MSARTGRGMKPISSFSSDQTSMNWRLDEAPKSCIRPVNISGSDSSGMKLFLYSIVYHTSNPGGGRCVETAIKRGV